MQTVRAPELQIKKWLNTESDISLESLIGKVVVIHTFQMLCPGCVIHALPQTQKIFQFFNGDNVSVFAIHTVFEHHSAMQLDSLQAFLYEFKYTFPVGIDTPDPEGDPIPLTMSAYACRGTPSLILIDKKGNIRSHYFGVVEDMQIGAEIMGLVME